MRTRSDLNTQHPNPLVENRPSSHRRRESQKAEQSISDNSTACQHNATAAPVRPFQYPKEARQSKQRDSQGKRSRKPLVSTPSRSPHAERLEQSNTSDPYQPTPTRVSVPVAHKVKKAPLDEQERQKLKMFDLNETYGPCVGLKRIFRWYRAESFGLQPPSPVYRILQSNRKYQDPNVDESIFYGSL